MNWWKQFDLLWVHLLLLILVCVGVFFTNLGEAQLWDRDEPRNAGCAAEMMARGDWIVPTFNDELRHQKPVLLYWLIISAYSVFGQTEFAARYWSALLAIGTVLATYGIGRRLAGPMVGLLAGIVLASNIMFSVAARAATPDSVLIFCGTVAIAIYVYGTFGSRSSAPIEPKVPGQWFPSQFGIVCAFYVMLGLGVLSKGPVGFLLPMAIIGMFMLIQRLPKSDSSRVTEREPGWAMRIRNSVAAMLAPFHPVHFWKTLCSMRPMLGAAIVLLVATPWYLLVHAQTEGDFTQRFFLGEHFGRATSAMENHGGGLWYYPVAIVVGFFPWSMFWGPVVATLVYQRKNAAESSAVTTLTLCWIAVQVGAFSLAQTKLPSYVTPCYPALAILTSYCLYQWLNGEAKISKRWYFAAMSGLAAGGLITSIGLAVAASKFIPSQMWILAIGLVPLIGGAIAIWQLFGQKRTQMLLTTGVCSVLFCILMFGFGTTSVDTAQHNQDILKYVADTENQTIASYRALESSWVFYGKKPIYESDANSTPDSNETLSRTKWWKPKPRITPEAIVRESPNAMFITTTEHVGELKNRLPEDFEVVQTADYFLKDRKIVLLARTKVKTASTANKSNTQTR